MEQNRSRNFSGGVEVVANGSRRASAKRDRVTRSIVGGDECSIETKYFSKKSVRKGGQLAEKIRFPVKEGRITKSKMKAITDSGIHVYEKCVHKSVSHTVVDVTNNDGRKLEGGGQGKRKSSLKRHSQAFPSTINHLLSTGLLEGLPVVYNGGKRGSMIQGIIKEGGILCFCEECKGCSVILISQFELHACKVKRHATQYIFLENGKSLRQIMEICKKKTNDTLEAIIRNAIGSFSENPRSFDSSDNVSMRPHLEKIKPDGYDSSLGRARPNIFICYSRTRPNVVGCSHSKSEAKPHIFEQPLCDSTTNSKEPSIKNIENKRSFCDSTTNSEEPTIKNIEKKRKRGRPRKSSNLPKSSTYKLQKSSTYKLKKSPTSKLRKSSTSNPPKSLTSKMPKSSTSKRSSIFLATESLKRKNEWKITKKRQPVAQVSF